VNILLLAPHPFYQDRGTPIAVDLLLRVFSERGDHVDVLTYHEGGSVSYPNVTVYRIPTLPFIRNIRPGFSLKKLVCDFFMFYKMIRLTLKNRYQVVHSVEESVFMAMILRSFFRIPYVYDMDSSMADQLVEKFPKLAFLGGIFAFFEGLAIKKSEAVLPVCDALASLVERYHPRKVVVLPDISILNGPLKNGSNRLKEELGVKGLLTMYVGNLEAYQGIDLLLESFAPSLKRVQTAGLAVIGGSAWHIRHYREKSIQLGIANSVYFLGPKPAADLGYYLSEADILVSPRIQGKNTPMKIYSYLDSGKAVLATNLPTHTQVLNDQVALLADSNPDAFSDAMLYLMGNEKLRLQLGERGKKYVEERYSYNAFRNTLCRVYETIEADLISRGRSS
jgi:glycosyltransferase involved in cell wall biosynthesis